MLRKKSHGRTLLATLSFLSLLALSPATVRAQDQRYRSEDFATLSLPASPFGAGTSYTLRLETVNNNSQALLSLVKNGETNNRRAAILDNGVLTILPLPTGYTRSYATALDESGNISGIVYGRAVSGAANLGYTWKITSGAVTSLVFLQNFYTNTIHQFPRAASDGIIVGEMFGNASTSYNARWAGSWTAADGLKLAEPFSFYSSYDSARAVDFTSKSISGSFFAVGEAFNYGTTEVGNSRPAPFNIPGYRALLWEAANNPRYMDLPSGYNATRAVATNENRFIVGNAFNMGAGNNPFTSEYGFDPSRPGNADLNFEIFNRGFPLSNAVPTRGVFWSWIAYPIVLNNDTSISTRALGITNSVVGQDGLLITPFAYMTSSGNRGFMVRRWSYNSTVGAWGGVDTDLTQVTDEFGTSFVGIDPNTVYDARNNRKGQIFGISSRNRNGSPVSAPILRRLTPVIVRHGAPSLSSVAPNRVEKDQSLVIIATGSNFYPPSVGYSAWSGIRFNGNTLPTTYVSSTELRATIPASMTATAGDFPVTVVNYSTTETAPFDGGVSAERTVRVGLSAPYITNATPNPLVLGNAAIPISLTGANFSTGMQIHFVAENAAGSMNFVGVAPVTSVTPTSATTVMPRYSMTSFQQLAQSGSWKFYMLVIGPAPSHIAPDAYRAPVGSALRISYGEYAVYELQFTSDPLAILSHSVGSVGTSSATITWTTNWIADRTAVQYGTTPALGQTVSGTSSGSTGTPGYFANLTGLASGTLYYYQVEATQGSTTVSQTGTFLTNSTGTPTITLASRTISRSATGVQVQVILKNTGAGAATNVSLSKATLLGVAATNTPLPLGTISVGASQSVTLTFPTTTPVGTGVLSIEGSHSQGNFSVNVRSTVP